jgi:hypothetical protein
MNWSAVAVLSAILAACTNTAERRQSELMNQIEANVRLPAGSWPLKKYARYYAFDGHGGVSAVYFVHGDGAIEKAKAFCSRGDVKGFPCGLDPGTLRMVRDGNRAWLESPEQFPAMSGGGCGEVEIHYSVDADRFDAVECNGPY